MTLVGAFISISMISKDFSMKSIFARNLAKSLHNTGHMYSIYSQITKID